MSQVYTYNKLVYKYTKDMEKAIQYKDRCLGVTRGIVLRFLGELLLNPNTELPLPVDHYDGYSERSKWRMRHILVDEIKRQDLCFIELNEKRNTMKFNPFGKTRMGWEIIE